MHGIIVENKGFKTLTDYVRVRYVPSASEHAVSGKTYKGVYWNGVKGNHAQGNISMHPDDAEAETLTAWLECRTTECRVLGLWTDTGVVKDLIKRETAGAMMTERKWIVDVIQSKADDSTYAHTLYF